MLTRVILTIVVALLVILLLWRRQVRATTDDSASSLFDFVPTAKLKNAKSRRPSSPHLSIQTMIGSQSLNEKERGGAYSYSSDGSQPVETEGSVETLT